MNRYQEGLTGFFERYESEHIVEYSPEENALLHQFDQCINCGLCLNECVVLRNLVSVDTEFAGPRHIGISLSRSLNEAWTTSDTIYHCTLCGACEAVCPGNVPIPAMVEMVRSKIYRQSEDATPRALRAMDANLNETGNIYGQNLEPLTHHDEQPEYVLFAGCVGTYLERESLAQTMALLTQLGVRFTTVDEVCCGGPTVVAGTPMSEELVERNLNAILASGANKVLTECPRCYLTLSRHPGYADQLDVLHTVEFLSRFDWPALTDEVVTYHDPCEIGRTTGDYDSPRKILSQVTPHYVEMPNTKESTVCCGAGGGLRGISPRLSINIARNRLEEALGAGTQVLVTECSSCLHNFRNARRSRDKIEIYSLSEYLSLKKSSPSIGVQSRKG